ncbi:helix-turn-helix domain-containing protein [Pseudomonas syringae]|uniref:MerR family transcriptional regulator n=1 Tax=Pseudomonas syringae TaxID=317 RepID=UPI0018E5F304|nr:helix-turn-helix domain-containing protein [Pseudomonas syringae]MBI6674248.1 helix-turn-helix domain-containing protein [Pseudomonas syringae]
MLGIGALSKSTGCHIETIRYYEKIGLLPTATRSAGRHRIYTEKHRSRLIFIRQNRELGFPLDDIRELIALAADAERPCADALSVVRKHLAEVEAKVAKLQQIRIDLLSMAGRCESTCLGSSTQDCTIVESLFEPAAGTGSGCCS